MSHVKRKGAYEYERDWSQNQSALVVPKVTEQVLLHDVPIADAVRNHKAISDFFLRTKVPRSSKLVWVNKDGIEYPMQNVTRYYVCQDGGSLVKIMPPLAKAPDKWRRIGIESGWEVYPCNDLNINTLWPAINYNYYIKEVEKLVLGLQ